MNIGSKEIRKTCFECGGCLGLCPEDAIRMQRRADYSFRLHINERQCSDCGICVSVCPAHNSLFTKSYFAEPVFGNKKEAWLAYATDRVERRSSASGGVVSVLLKYLLSNAIVDTALVTRLEKEGNRLVPRSRFIESADEVDAFKGSVYVQTRPAELIDMNFIKSDRRAVLVGLPCHVQSVALMKKRFPKLNGRLFAIGLFCSHNATRDNLTYVLKNLHKTESELDSFNFRVPGWGYQDSFLTGWINHWFCQKGCMYCQDVFSDFADISVGDACLDRLMQEKECDGYSITIARNEVSQQWCRELEDMGRLTLAPVSCEDIVACHTFPILHKIRSFAFRCRILPYMTTGVPRAGNQRLSLKDMVVIVGLEISGILSKAPGISGLLRILPFRLMRSIQRRIGGMM